MKSFLSVVIFVVIPGCVCAQVAFDSISISRCLISEEWHNANWPDTLKAGRFHQYLQNEKTVWVKPAVAGKTLPGIVSLSNRIRNNGTDDVSKCFIPRHSINFYKGGRIARYLLVCFECDGVRFSDQPAKTFIKSVGTRDKQMAELKKLFKDIL